MNYFDDEENIIDYLQCTDAKNVNTQDASFEAIKFFRSIYIEELFRYWTNSSAKNALPPDFFSDKYKYMLEVMRIDDYQQGINSPNALESKFLKKVDNERRRNGLPSLRDNHVKVLFLPNMSKASSNDYETYVESFKRIVSKHINKIEKYRENHPGYKLGFLILDESPGYVYAQKPNIQYKHGDAIRACGLHILPRDKNFMEIFLDTDLDFLIWLAPCKNLAENPAIYPDIYVIDLKKIKKKRKKLFAYPVEKMVCLEVEE